MSHIRSDHILWIDEQLPIAQQHINALKNLSQLLNQAFYLGIKEVEAHFACYNAGEFYALHRDNPQKKNDRMISTVFIYMNSGKKTLAVSYACKIKMNNGIPLNHCLIGLLSSKVIYYMKCCFQNSNVYQLQHGYAVEIRFGMPKPLNCKIKPYICMHRSRFWIN